MPVCGRGILPFFVRHCWLWLYGADEAGVDFTGEAGKKGPCNESLLSPFVKETFCHRRGGGKLIEQKAIEKIVEIFPLGEKLKRFSP